MKLLFILENYYPNIGGVETLFKSLCESLANDGHSVTVLTNKFRSDLPERETINDVRIRRVPFRNRYLFTFFGFFPALKYARKADIIHTTSYNAALPAFVAGLLTRKKVLITFHEVWGKLWFRLPFMSKFTLWLHYVFEQLILRIPFHTFIAVSDYTAGKLADAGVNRDRIQRIYNGIDYSDYRESEGPRNNEFFRFIYFGRLGISKGLDILIGSLALLKPKYDHIRLDLVIPTLPRDFHQRIQDEIVQFGIADITTVYSDLPKARLRTLIHNADSVVIPSYSEGFCFSAVESMAMGKPLVTSGKGALAEVAGGKFIHAEELTANSFAKAMEKAIQNNWEIQEKRMFPLATTIQEYLALYARLLNRP